MKVAFLVAGTQKGGTTALDAYLREHPDLCMASKKEVHFFDDETCFAAEPDYGRYHAFFPQPPADGQVLFGESTPIYMYWRAAPERICKYNPKMKIILALRNPIERAFSHWNMQRARGSERLPFRDAIQAEAERGQTSKPMQNRMFSYIDRGYYAEQLKRIWHYFPPAQTLALRSEEISAESPLRALDRIWQFLGVDPLPGIGSRRKHTGHYPSRMRASDWNYLRDRFESDIRELEQMLGWDCSHWLCPSQAGLE